jgi:ferredoxin-NADP reductase/DMSO/TMAO reductase YedYZ heme-binding membrane subunit
MSTSEPMLDTRLLKQLTLISALVPAVLLTWDAWHGQLGVNAVNFVIRTTGLVGLVLMTLSLLVTPLRELTGWSRAIAMRRGLGVVGFGYLALHVLVFFLLDRQASLSSTVHEIVTRRYLWFGTGALLLMIPLAATSTDAMVTRLGATAWKRLHRLAYPIAIGAVIHYYLLIKSDVTQPLAFAAVIGALLLYRVLRHHLSLRAAAIRPRPALVAGRDARSTTRPWSGELVVTGIFVETPDVKTFRLAPIGGGPLPFTYRAGQYLNLALAVDGRRINRSYTIASSPTRAGYCEISVKRAAAGGGSAHLHDAWREGLRVQVSAPAGSFVFAPGLSPGLSSGQVAFVAGGIGITPMLSMIRNLTDQAWIGDIYLLYTVQGAADIAFRDELTWLASRFANLRVRILLTREEAWGRDRASGLVAHGRITRETIASFVPDVARGPVMLCGPAPMMAAMRQTLVAMGVPDRGIRQEAFVSPPSPDGRRRPEAAVTGPDAAVAAASTDAGATVPDANTAIVFRRTGRAVDAAPGLTVLEAAEDAGVAIPYECRAGICGQCKTPLLAGRVAMEVQDALSAADRARGLILACQARALQPVEIDA